MDIGFPRKKWSCLKLMFTEQSGIVLRVFWNWWGINLSWVCSLPLPPLYPFPFLCLSVYIWYYFDSRHNVSSYGNNNKTSSRDIWNWELLWWLVCKISLLCGVSVKSEKKKASISTTHGMCFFVCPTKDDRQYLMLGDHLVIVYHCC